MKRTSTTRGFLTLMALLVLGVVSAESTSAQVFLWTGPLPGLVLVLSQNPQVFSFEPGGTELVCQHFKGHGILANGKAMTTKEITLAGNYTSCKLSGILEVAFSPVEYLLNASGSLSVIGKPIVITIPSFGCSIKFNNGAPNSSLKTIKFLNLPQDVSAHLELSKLTSLSSGGECGTAGVEKTEATLRGLLLIGVDGGTTKWDP